MSRYSCEATMERRAKDEKETRQRKRRVVKKSGKVKKAATGSEIEGGGLRRRSRNRNVQIARDNRDESVRSRASRRMRRATTERVRKAPARDLGEPQKIASVSAGEEGHAPGSGSRTCGRKRRPGRPRRSRRRRASRRQPAIWRGIEGGEVSVERRGRVKESREVASRRHAADKGGL